MSFINPCFRRNRQIYNLLKFVCPSYRLTLYRTVNYPVSKKIFTRIYKQFPPELFEHSYQPSRTFSTSVQQPDIDYNIFDKVCEETLESLTEYFEELLESSNTLQTADVSYSGGVLTVQLGDKYGTYVINRQSPNKQIWLSSPISGPKRYDLVSDDLYWIYKHDGKTLHQLLQREFSQILKDVDFSKCAHSKL